MSEREGTAEEFARMIAGGGEESTPSEQGAESDEPTSTVEAAVFAALREKGERNRALVEALHPPPKEQE